jgi:hypothetical protein
MAVDGAQRSVDRRGEGEQDQAETDADDKQT